jgi:hypothetical protein
MSNDATRRLLTSSSSSSSPTSSTGHRSITVRTTSGSNVTNPSSDRRPRSNSSHAVVPTSLASSRARARFVHFSFFSTTAMELQSLKSYVDDEL